MYKRAYMFSSNAPVTIDEQDVNEGDTNDPDDSKKESDKSDEDLTTESETIKSYPGNKVSYCTCCKGKTFLNKDSIDKHLKSKNHLKNVKKNEKEVEKVKKMKKEFLKRMIEVDNRAINRTF